MVPLKRRKRIEVFTIDPDDLWTLYTLIQENTPDETRVTIARCDEEHLGAWMANNVEPTWWERTIGRIRFTLNVMVAP